MEPPSQFQSELEDFREQWRAEVSARSRNANNTPAAAPPPRQRMQPSPSASFRPPPRRPEPPPAHGRPPPEEEDDFVPGLVFDDPAPSKPAAAAAHHGAAAATGAAVEEPEPDTALELYEKAVDKESTGKLGDSLHLYRKAFRLNDSVDRAYRDKHFPGRWKQAAPPPASGAPVPVPAPAPAAPAPRAPPVPTPSLPDLIASFAGLKVEGAPPEVEGMTAPPCPIADLPDEILVHILRDIAVQDVGDFVRLAQVCKSFAYLVATEDQIWRRVCLGPEFGFAGMVYHWQRGIAWEELDPERELGDDDELFTLDQLRERHAAESTATTYALAASLYTSSWQQMFRRRPRIRFNGCYISTVNYIRQGQSSGNHITWNSPVHIVTYYRYLRFFRDGTVISLLTTAEPADVVHYLTKELVHQHANNGAPHLPSSVMALALKGRWRLSSLLDRPDADLSEVEGDVFVETEGVRPKYSWKMELSIKSAGKAARGNKLVWKGFWSYNRMTDDWGEFPLKNDKAYYFSRVKSYGFAGV